MNDPMEYEYALSILKESMIQYEQTNNIDDKKSSRIFQKDGGLTKFSTAAGQPYLLSFSEHPDDLSMWRAYGKDGVGISIGFNIDMLKQYSDDKEIYNTKIMKCEYESRIIISELIDYWDTWYNKIQVSEDGKKLGLYDHNFLFMITSMCFKAKSKSYMIENEWRLCKSEFDLEKVNFNVRGNVVVPYVEHYFDKSIIKEVIVGPSVNIGQAETALILFLKKFKYYNVEVKRSNISYRLL